MLARWTAVTILMAVTLTGCGEGGGRAEDGGTATGGPLAVVFEEDFSDNSAGWIPGGHFEGENTILEIVGGRMRHFVKTAEGRGGVDTTGLDVPNAADLASLGDVSIQATAGRSDLPEDSFYGLTCRQVDFDNFYGFVLVEGGSYSIFRIEKGVTTELAGGTHESVSSSGFGINEIRADCIGTTLAMFIDDQEVARFSGDSTFSSGAVGFLVETRGVPGLEVLFDDLVIRTRS